MNDELQLDLPLETGDEIQQIQQEEEVLDEDIELEETDVIEEDWIHEGITAMAVWEFIANEAQGVENRERETTRENKEKFLVAYEEAFCSVTDACYKVGINRHTYYEWIKWDKNFASACEEIRSNRLPQMVEDNLLSLVKMKDGGMTRFYLQAMDPRYKKTVKNEIVVAGVTTFEDLLYSQAQNNKAEKEKTKDNDTNK